MGLRPVIVQSVSGTSVTTTDGLQLIHIGNRPLYAGDTAYTDGRYTYGFASPFGGSLLQPETTPALYPYIAELRAGSYFGYLQSQRETEYHSMPWLDDDGTPSWDREKPRDYFVAGKTSAFLIRQSYTDSYFHIRNGRGETFTIYKYME